MRPISKYTFLAFLPLLFMSCYKDRSDFGNKELSELSISFPDITDVVQIEKNEILTIEPVITQSGKEKPLTYEWQVNYEDFSTEKKLEFEGANLGTYFVRLKVTNEDGSAFKSFTLNVNSPYEEGLMVLGVDEQGEGTLSFMRKFTPAEIAAGREETFATNVFTLNNPDEKIGKGPTDIAKRQKQILISSGTEGKIYFLNDKTFEVEASISAPDLPGFKPVKMNVPDEGFITAAVLSENGVVYKLASKEYLIMTDARFPQNVINKTDFGYNLNDLMNYFWDANTKKIMQVSAYYQTDSGNDFAGQELVTFFFDNPSSFYVISKSENNPSVYTKTVYSNYLRDVLQKTTLNVSGTPVLNPASSTLVNSTFKKLIYADDNAVYSWFYTGTDMPTAPFINVSEGTITGLEQSPDGRELYVGVYNPNASGLKGSVLVYDMDNGRLIKKHEGIADKPVKLFYKKKS